MPTGPQLKPFFCLLHKQRRTPNVAWVRLKGTARQDCLAICALDEMLCGTLDTSQSTPKPVRLRGRRDSYVLEKFDGARMTRDVGRDRYQEWDGVGA